MAYRDDLEAALEHAAALERDLARAKEEVARDEARIAELEKRLAAAQQNAETVKQREPPTAKVTPAKPLSSAPGPWKRGVILVVGGIALLFIGVIVISVGRAKHDEHRTQAIDVSRQIEEATRVASQKLPGAQLASIQADYVDAQGVSDLAAYNGRVVYGFVGPQLEAPPEPAHRIGAPPPTRVLPTCAVDVRYLRDFDGVNVAGSGYDCGAPLPHPPSCKVAYVWAEAIRRGAPPSALAEIRLSMGTHYFPQASPSWHFQIVEKLQTVFEMDLADQCPIAH
jgi:hypothetical protein